MTQDAQNFRKRLGIALVDVTAQSKGRVTVSALALMLEAADDAAAMVAEGATPEAAFAEVYTPTRDMHKVARRLDLDVDVDHGRWTIKEA